MYFSFETRDGFCVPKPEYQAIDLDVYPEDLSGMLCFLVAYAQGRGWLSPVESFEGLVAFRRGDVSEDDYEADLLFSKSDLPLGTLSTCARRDRHTGRQFRTCGELVINANLVSSDCMTCPRAAVYIDFELKGALIYQTRQKLQVNITGEAGGEYIYFEIDESDQRSVTVQRGFDWGMLYGEGGWERGAKRFLASLGIDDRAVENFSLESLMRLADLIVKGELKGGSFDRVQHKINRILASGG